MIWLVQYRSIPLERLKQITDLLESDITIRYVPSFASKGKNDTALSFGCTHLYRSIHDVKATDMGADTVRFKAEVNFDGREIAKIVINQLDLEKVVKVRTKVLLYGKGSFERKGQFNVL